MNIELIGIIVLFFMVAVIYSAAGFGGGSSYLAILSMFTLEYTALKLIALLCNVVVVSGSVFWFYRNGLIHIKKVIPLIALSIPLAFLGGMCPISENLFFILLGITLFIASLIMLFNKNTNEKKLPKYSNGFTGGGIGFLSGLVGIGGGIFLSPVLHITQWAKPKMIAATTALFILVNSIAGIAGQLVSNDVSLNTSFLMCLMISVFIGGQIGSRTSINKLNPLTVKRLTGILILLVSLRILWKYLF